MQSSHAMQLSYFNSIKVRLKLFILHSLFGYNLFQFHKGTIKTQGDTPIQRQDRNFNSIKVRLKQVDEHITGGVTLKFQFHKGTIKTTIPRTG